MTIALTGSGGLFTIFKKAIAAIAAANTSQATTVSDAVDDMLAEIGDLDTIEGTPRASRVSDAAKRYRNQLTLQREISSFFKALLIDRVTDDAPHVPAEQELCINELVRQMNAAGTPEKVERNVVSASVSSSPSGAPKLLISATGGDGITLQQMLPETIVGKYRSPTSLTLESGAEERDKLSPLWPKGSGSRKTLTVDTDGLLVNQSFDDDTIQANSPDGWVVTVGTIGTTLALTVTEIQTITISGGPSSGYWKITFTRTDSIVQTTKPLAYNASASDVEEALAELDGIESVTVSSSGTLPSSVVYTINFNSVAPPGNQSALSASNNFNTGSIAVAEVTAGQSAFEHRSLTILGNGSQLTALRQPLQNLSLTPSTVYAFSIQGKTGGASTTGTLIIELVDGAGTVINDDAGTANQTSVDISTISTSVFDPYTAFFRTPANLPEVFYLQIRLSVAIPATKVLYLDDCLFARTTQLYRNGPFAALLGNDRNIQAADRYEIAIANNFAGNIQTYFGRIFERQLPSATSGSETIAD